MQKRCVSTTGRGKEPSQKGCGLNEDYGGYPEERQARSQKANHLSYDRQFLRKV